jgi:hypothetical protein
MGWYDEMAKAQVGGQGPKLPTNAKLRLALMNIKEASPDNIKKLFVSEWFVVASDSPLLPAGTANAGYVIRLDGQYHNHIIKSQGEVKGLIAALLGMPATSPEAAAISAAVVEGVSKQPARLYGAMVDAQTFSQKPSAKKLAENPNAESFTKANFFPVTPGKIVVHPGMPPLVTETAQTQTAPTSIASSVQGYVASTGGPPPGITMPGSPPASMPFPPPGWAEHPDHPGYFYNRARPGVFPARVDLEKMAAEGKA